MVFKGEIEIGAILAVVQLMNYLVDPVIALSSLMNMYKEAKPLYDRVQALITSPIVKEEKLQLYEPISLTAQNINFTYGDRPMLEDFSYVFSPGKKYLIKGESGSGKSTLAKILAGELAPNRGEVLINDKDITTFDY